MKNSSSDFTYGISVHGKGTYIPTHAFDLEGDMFKMYIYLLAWSCVEHDPKTYDAIADDLYIKTRKAVYLVSRLKGDGWIAVEKEFDKKTGKVVPIITIV